MEASRSVMLIILIYAFIIIGSGNNCYYLEYCSNLSTVFPATHPHPVIMVCSATIMISFENSGLTVFIPCLKPSISPHALVLKISLL
jgi:hypothetical protein